MLPKSSLYKRTKWTLAFISVFLTKMTQIVSVFSRSSIIKWHAACVQSNSTTLWLHVHSYVFIVYPPRLGDCKAWDHLPGWVNRNFPNPQNKSRTIWSHPLHVMQQRLHVSIQRYYLTVKNCSSFLKKISYSSKCNTHTIYSDDNSLQVPSSVRFDTCATPFKYLNLNHWPN